MSFELYPPRGTTSISDLVPTITHLASAGPEFISVTYSADGRSQNRSIAVLRAVLEQTGVEPMAHLTCIGMSRSAAGDRVQAFLDAGITAFLALRGDPPEDEADDVPGAFDTAAPFVDLILSRAGRARSAGGTGEHASPTAPARVAVAAFPNGHEPDRRPEEDIDALLEKQAAGATSAMTQLFFRADDYLAFRDRAVAAGVTIPIVPGIMPVVRPGQLRKAVALAGEQHPDDLASRLDSTDDPEEQFAIGIGQAATLARQVLAGGAPALHLYTLNRHRPVLAVLDELGIDARRPAAIRTEPV